MLFVFKLNLNIQSMGLPEDLIFQARLGNSEVNDGHFDAHLTQISHKTIMNV